MDADDDVRSNGCLLMTLFSVRSKISQISNAYLEGSGGWSRGVRGSWGAEARGSRC